MKSLCPLLLPSVNYVKTATLNRIENGEECDDQGKEAAIHDFNRRTEERRRREGHTKRAPRLRVGL